MKMCSTCSKEKYLNEFRKDANTRDGYQPRCKCCTKLRQAERYKESYHVKAKTNAKNRRLVRYQQLKELIQHQGGCIVCGESDPPCIEFHHLDPTKKDFTISSSTSLRWELVELEIAKCVMLCGNHHRLVHLDNFDLTPFL